MSDSVRYRQMIFCCDRAGTPCTLPVGGDVNGNDNERLHKNPAPITQKEEAGNVSFNICSRFISLVLMMVFAAGGMADNLDHVAVIRLTNEASLCPLFSVLRSKRRLILRLFFCSSPGIPDPRVCSLESNTVLFRNTTNQLTFI